MSLTNPGNSIGRGEFIIVLDSTDRENEGDLIIAAEDLTTEKMAFMVRWTRYHSTPLFRPTSPLSPTSAYSKLVYTNI